MSNHENPNLHQAAGREQVIAFRLESHHLNRRLPPGSHSHAAGACGLQNTPPGSAALALHARVDSLTPTGIEEALYNEKTLLQSWSLRGAPYLYPTREAAVFTLGLLPEGEEQIRSFILGVEPALEKIGLSAVKMIQVTEAALVEELDGRALTKNELGVRLSRWVSQMLASSQLDAWNSPSWYVLGQTLGESVLRFALPILALKGLCCHGAREGDQAYIQLTRQWLGQPLPEVDPEQASAGLVRGYLHCYGPSTCDHFAAWAGIAPTQAVQAWNLVEQELVEIRFDGRKNWILLEDLPRFLSPSPPVGIRFLPPHDPYLQLRDRATLVQDQKLQRVLWRTSGNPGVILVDGQLVAAWRSHKEGRRLVVTVERFAAMEQKTRSEIEAEAMTLTPFKNCSSMEILFG